MTPIVQLAQIKWKHNDVHFPDLFNSVLIDALATFLFPCLSLARLLNLTCKAQIQGMAVEKTNAQKKNQEDGKVGMKLKSDRNTLMLLTTWTPLEVSIQGWLCYETSWTWTDPGWRLWAVSKGRQLTFCPIVIATWNGSDCEWEKQCKSQSLQYFPYCSPPLVMQLVTGELHSRARMRRTTGVSGWQ